jgi:hypothetical protein
MNNKHQENGALTGPLIFTQPASSFVVILNFDWLDGTTHWEFAALEKMASRELRPRGPVSP